jgi:hypothetical protein
MKIKKPRSYNPIKNLGRHAWPAKIGAVKRIVKQRKPRSK